MKHVIEGPSAANFAPVTLRLTFESQEELDAITTLFNSGRTGRALSTIGFSRDKHTALWRDLYHAGGEGSSRLLEFEESL